MSTTWIVLASSIIISTVQSNAQSLDHFNSVRNIETALRIMKHNGSWVTGMGCMFAWIPGTPARDLEVALESVKASLWAYEVTTRCPYGPCSAPERKLIRQGLDAEFSQCVSYSQLEYNLKRRLSK